MIRTGKLTAMCSLVAILACSSLAGTEPNDANTPLMFEVGPTELPTPSFRMGTGIRSRMPSFWKGPLPYAAGVILNDSPHFLHPGESAVNSFIEFALSLDLSEQQRRLLSQTHAGLESHQYYTPPEDPNSTQLLLYAASLDDAKKMAEAYLQFARDRYNHKVAPLQNEVKRLSEWLAAKQEKQPEVIRAAEVAEKAFQELAKQVPYRDEKQALDAAAELDRMLNTAQVDIAGIQAMLKAIQDRMTPTALAAQPQSLKEKLEVMFAEESIALQAAEARKRMAMTLRKQADSYIDLKEAMQTANREKSQLAHDIAMWPDMIRRAREVLAAEMQKEPKIINDKVFIYPVRQPDGAVEK